LAARPNGRAGKAGVNNCRRAHGLKPASGSAFAQILGKLHSIQLRENFRRIVLEYGQNPHIAANRPFNAAC
jgi:hypothetical protein